MIKAAIATAAFITCCLGNPADASTCKRNCTNRTVNRTEQRQANRQVNRQVLTVNEGDEATQHAPIPQPVGPVAADSVAVLTFYGQVDEAGPVGGVSISIPLQ